MIKLLMNLTFWSHEKLSDLKKDIKEFKKVKNSSRCCPNGR